LENPGSGRVGGAAPVGRWQFTTVPFTGLLLKNGITLSMDERGLWRDNVFVGRAVAGDGDRQPTVFGVLAGHTEPAAKRSRVSY
jgi:hypothetical protein